MTWYISRFLNFSQTLTVKHRKKNILLKIHKRNLGPGKVPAPKNKTVEKLKFLHTLTYSMSNFMLE